MTPPHALSSDLAAPPMPPLPTDEITVDTRFGTMACRRAALMDMQQGPLGFAQHRQFALLDLPNPKLAQFRLLQSLSDRDVSFVVLPAGREGGPIAASDLDDACLAAGFAPADVLVLLIVTVRSGPEGVAMTMNLRAPVVVDTRNRAARQVVLANATYSVRHPL